MMKYKWMLGMVCAILLVSQSHATCDSDCNITLHGDSGCFTSPNYPYKYLDNKICTYNITVEEGMVIKLTFSDLETGINGDVRIREKGIEVANYSGGTIPDPLYSTTNALYIVFTSGNIIGSVAGESTDNDSSEYFFFSASFTGLPGSHCNQKLNGNSGYFTSPNYPDKYPKHQNCTYNVIVPVELIIKLTFSDFKTGALGSIVLISENGSLIAGITGIYERGPIFYSTSYTISVRFSSDDSASYTGFSANFTALPGPNCGNCTFMDPETHQPTSATASSDATFEPVTGSTETPPTAMQLVTVVSTVHGPNISTATVVNQWSQTTPYFRPPSTAMADGILRSRICREVVVGMLQSAILDNVVRKIKNELTVNKSNLSSVTRKKVSQEDDRKSSAAIGYFGVTFCVLPLVLITILDISKLMQYLKTNSRDESNIHGDC
ncbi:tolloid-like protein 2 [Patella vulgata]|uniref:tolloid-like protein 2 n=1 Tax=Patella vulgata TaxID=6465 RepID=UPI0021800520|nr:tolloid-like protein 2 [Patella vulgata]